MAASTVNSASLPSSWLSVSTEGARGLRAGGLAIRGGGGACGRAGNAAAHRVSSRCGIRRTATSWEMRIPMLIPLLIPQYTQRGFEFSQGMRVARGGDAAAVEFARVVEAAQLLERLPAVIIGCRIRRIGNQHGFEFRDRARPFACVDVFHRQSVTG